VRRGHRAALERALAEHIASGVAQAPLPDCAAALGRALEQHANSTIFFYLDPYGIKDLEFDMVRQIYERAQRRSTEVLINFNFRAFMRMSGNWKYADSADEIARRVKEEKVETVNRVMGGEYWKDIILNPALTKIDREDAVIGAYLSRIREFFPYAYAIPVKERDHDQQNIPVDELAHYHLIFATRSPRAVVYMNDVGLNALEPYLNQFKDGLLFDFTPERYQKISDEDAKKEIVEAATEKPLTRPEIYEAVFPRFFMHHKKLAYRAWIDDLVFKEGRLHPKRDEMKSKTQLNDNVRLWAKPWDLL
jgi:three-Cys-motif partner protein